MRVYIIPSFVLSLLVVLATLSTAISAANSHTSKSSFLFKQFDDEVSTATTQNNNKQQNAVDQQQRSAVELSNNGPSSPTPAPSTTVSPSLNNITWETINSCATTSGENENDCSIQAASDLPSHSYAAYKIPLDVSTSDLRNIDIVVNLQDDAVCEESVYVEWKLKEVPSLLPWTITHDGSTGDEGAPDLFRALLILPLEKSLMCNTRPDIQKSFQGIDPSQEQALYVLVQSRRTASSPDWPPAPSDNSSTTTTPAPTTLYPGHHHTEAPPGSRCAVNVYVNIRKTSVWRTHAYLIIFSAAAIFFLTPMFIILNLLLARRDGQHHLYLFPLRRLMYVNVLMFFPSVIFFYTTKLITTTVTKAHECGRKNKCCVACCCPRNRIKRRTNVSGSSNGSNNSGNSMTNLEGQPPQQPSNNNNHQEEEEEIVCRICFDGDEEEDLLQPCNCTGSAAYIHQSCLDKWRVQSSNQRVQRAASCEICLAPFRIPVSRAAVFKMVALRVLYLVVFFASAYGIITVNFLFEAFAISPMTCTAPYESSFTGPLSNIQTYVVGALTYLVVAYAIYVATQITWMIWFNVATPFERDPRDEEAQNNNPAEENLLGGENNNINNNNNNENNNNDGVGAVAVNVGAARNNGNDDEDDERQELLGNNNNNNVQHDNNNEDDNEQQQPRHSPRENHQQEQEAPPARQDVAANNNNNDENAHEHNHNHHQENQDPILAPPNLIAPEDENDNQPEVQEGNNNNNNHQQNNENNHNNDNNNIDVVPENIRRIRDYAERQRARPVTSFFHSWKVLFLVIYFLFWQFCGVVLLCFLYKWIIYNHRSDFAWSWGIPFPAMIIIVMFITLAILVVAVLRALAQRCIHAERRETDRIAAENRQEEQDERDIAEEQQAQQQQQQQQNQEVEAEAPQVAVD